MVPLLKSASTALICLLAFTACKKTGETATPSNLHEVSTLAGSTPGFADGPAQAALFDGPNGVAVDAQGTVYVADLNNYRIRRITANTVGTLAGTGISGKVDGAAATAQFNELGGVALDAQGALYVADTGNNCIRKINSTGLVSTLAGNGTAGFADGSSTAASFNAPAGVAVDAQGNVYVADTGNNRIRKISPAGVVSTLAGTGVQGLTNGAGAGAQFDYPLGVGINAQGVVYVADAGNHALRSIATTGEVSTLAGGGSPGLVDGMGTSARLNSPSAVAVDAQGVLYVADTGNNCIRKVSAAGATSILAGSAIAGAADGAGDNAKFDTPASVAVDGQGNVYVADFSNNRIRKIKAQ